ncbi:MAG: threonine synthase [Candidatus Aminicenantes bacterium]|nr:threonine synthase [Candidatus Aminicenantes bacterium]
MFPFCPECKEPLLISYPSRKRELFLEKDGLERYSDFLPLKEINKNLGLGEGNTPLLSLDRIQKKFTLPFIWAKDETTNPTHSFKDRGSAVAIQKAATMGVGSIGTVSTGNMAASTAAYGDRAGLKTYIFLKEDTSQEKLLSTALFNPILVKVKGDYGALFRKSYSLGQKLRIYFMNSVDPFRIEGYKVTGYEIFQQLNRQAPQYIFVPLSSGGHLIGLMRAFLELKQEGLIHNYPTFVGIQAKGCSPIARAFIQGNVKVERMIKARTIAQAISNPDPPGGNIALKMIRENKGMIMDVSDKEILAAQEMLAEEEGLFCQPASATALAALLKLPEKMQFEGHDKIVLIITGKAIKSTPGLESLKPDIHQTSLSGLEKTMNSLLI